MKTKRILAILLSVMMIFSIIPTMAFAEEEASGFDNFKKVLTLEEDKLLDVKNTDWFFDNLKSVYESGLMVGRSETEFAPEENMTVAEAMTIAARLNSIYMTGKAEFAVSEPWYQVYTDYCEENSIADIANYEPNALITRGQFADIFANALPEEALAQINEIANGAIPDVKEGDAFSEAIYALYRAGILVGNDEKGTFASNTNIKRNEVTAITGRMAFPAQRQKITLKVEGAEYTVSFDLGYDNKTLDSIKVKDGEKATAPKNPTRSGYNFGGWYTLKTGGTKFDFSKAITADTALYAHWNKVSSGGSSSRSYTVTFVSAKGEAPAPITVKSGNKIEEPTAEAEGYYVEGWYKEAEFQNKWNFAADTVKSNITLYANWIVEDRTFKAVAVEDGEGKYTLSFYYDNVDHSAEGNVYEGTVLFDETGSFGGKWGYDSIRSKITGVEIDESVKKYHGLTSTEFMFSGLNNCESIKGAENLDVSNVTNMKSMFLSYGSHSASADNVPNVSGWDTSKVQNMNGMFYSFCGYNTAINEIPDVSNWDTSSVTDMSGLFQNYAGESETLVKVPDVSNWNTSSVTNMSDMFNNYAGGFKAALTVMPDVSGFNTSNVTNITRMFYLYGQYSKDLKFELDLSNWDTSKVTTADDMFLCAGGLAGKDGGSGTWNVKIPHGQKDGNNWKIGDVVIEAPEGRAFEEKTETITLADLMATQEGFPTSEDNAWVNTTNAEKKMWLSDGNLNGANTNWVNCDYSLTKTDGGYEFEWNAMMSYKVTFNMDGDTLTSIELSGTSASDSGAAGTYAPKSEGLVDGYYLIGKLNGVAGWTVDAVTSDMKLEENEDVSDEWILDWTFYEGDQIKVVKIESGAITTWYNDTENNNYVITASNAGEGRLYFSPYGSQDWEYYYFEVEAKVPETRILMQILATNTDFPIAPDDMIPDNSWVSTNGAQAFVNPDDMLCFYKDGTMLDVAITETFTQDGDNFVFKDGDTTFTCIIKDGKLDSIKIETENTDYADLVGTYTPPETKTLAEILPDDFPTINGNAWKSANGAKCGTFNDSGIAFSGNNFQTLVLFTKELTKDGNNWKSVTLEGNPVTFVMTEGKLTSIEISGYTEDKAGVNGTYKPAAPVINTIADVIATAESGPENWRASATNYIYIYGENIAFVYDCVADSAYDEDSVGYNEAVTQDGDNWKFTDDDKTITFYMSGGKLVKISYDAVNQDKAIYSGTYAPVPKTITLAELMATQEGFPTDAASGWVNSNGHRMYYALDESEEFAVLFTKGPDVAGVWLYATDELTETQDGYVYSYSDEEYSCTVTFVMDDDTLTSITIEDSIEGDDNGTYEPDSTFTLAKLMAMQDDFPSSKDSGWVSTLGNRMYFDYYDMAGMCALLLYDAEFDYASAMVPAYAELTVCDDGYQYDYENLYRIKFCMDSDILTEIIVTTYKDETFVPADQTKSVRELIGNTLPTYEDDSYWQNKKGAYLYADYTEGYIYIQYTSGDYIHFGYMAIKDGDNWKTQSCYGASVTFVMTEGKLTSIEVSDSETTGFNGTYVESITLSELMAMQEGFPGTKDKGWVNSNGHKMYYAYDTEEDDNVLSIADADGNTMNLLYSYDALREVANGYEYSYEISIEEYEYYYFITITFAMDGNTITAITVTDTLEGDDNGTYEPKAE